MLPQKNRLKKRKELGKVFQKGQVFKEDFLILRAVQNNLNSSRSAFVVSKKVSKKVVLRNKIKRRLRGLLRAKIKEIKEGTDILLIALPGLEKKSFREMEKTVNKLFKKARLIGECLKS